DALRAPSVPVPHRVQERVAFLSGDRLAPAALRPGVHRPAASGAFRWQYTVRLEEPEKGNALVIFPEGGRTPDGEIKPFMAGAFFLAIKAQVDIVPVALIGTFDLLPMNTYHIKSRPLEMRVGEPIPTAGHTLHDLESLSAKVKSAMEALHRAE